MTDVQTESLKPPEDGFLESDPFVGVLLELVEHCKQADVWATKAGSQYELLAMFGLVDDALRTLRLAHEAVGVEVMHSADDGDEIPGGGVLEINPGGRRKNFDVDRLRARVAAEIASYVNMDDDPRVAVIVEKAWEVAPCTPSAGFRATGAKNLGIKLGDYSEWEEGVRSARIKGRPKPY